MRAAKPATQSACWRGLREHVAAHNNVTAIDYSEGAALDPRGNARQRRRSAYRRRGHRRGQQRRHHRRGSAARRERQSGEANNRSRLDLPGNQQALVDALIATGKPVTVVLFTGRALAVPALAEHSAALLHAFFPGTEGGRAITDVLCSATSTRVERNPSPGHAASASCRFTTTIRRTAGLTSLNAAITRRTGSTNPMRPCSISVSALSYSKFRLEGLQLPARLGREQTLTVRARITNDSDRDGDEVPQLYIRRACRAPWRASACRLPAPASRGA